MNELEAKYRAAPRQKSPAGLDNYVLQQAKKKFPAQAENRRLVFSPWRTGMVSLAIVGLAVTVLLRYGVPPIGSPLPPDMVNQEVATVVIERKESAEGSSEQMESLLADLEPGLHTAPSSKSSTGTIATTTDQDVADNVSALSVELEDLQGTGDSRLRSAEVISESVAASVTAIERQGSVNNSPQPVPVGNPPQVTQSLRAPAESDKTPDKGKQVLSKATAVSRSSAQPSQVEKPLDLTLEKERSDAWMAIQSGAHVTVRLATSIDPFELVNVARSLGLLAGWYLVVIPDEQRHQTDNFGLFYGVFESEEAALADISRLSLDNHTAKPRVYSFNMLRKETATH